MSVPMTLTASAMLTLRGTLQRALADNTRLRRKNTLLRNALLHDCPVCRIAWCDERERLVHEALGREWQTLRTPDNP